MFLQNIFSKSLETSAFAQLSLFTQISPISHLHTPENVRKPQRVQKLNIGMKLVRLSNPVLVCLLQTLDKFTCSLEQKVIPKMCYDKFEIRMKNFIIYFSENKNYPHPSLLNLVPQVYILFLLLHCRLSNTGKSC